MSSPRRNRNRNQGQNRKGLIQISGLSKSYRMGRADLHVLRGVSLRVEAGEFLAIVGASGSGKSTLLHLAGLLDTADKGLVKIDGVETTTLSGRARTMLRRHDIGFVFQFYHLLPELNVLENVLIASMTGCGIIRWPGRVRQARHTAVELLETLGLGKRLTHRPRELSGGERQRVAIARALVNQPDILLADEPTGNLDRKTGDEILDVLKRFHTDRGQTLVMVTHDAAVADRADRVVHLEDGRLQ